MNNTSRLWKVLGALLVVSFGILLYFGREIYLAAPPMPTAVKTVTGQTLFTQADIEAGRVIPHDEAMALIRTTIANPRRSAA